MHKKFEINRTKIKGGCNPNSKSDLPLMDIIGSHLGVKLLLIRVHSRFSETTYSTVEARDSGFAVCSKMSTIAEDPLSRKFPETS